MKDLLWKDFRQNSRTLLGVGVIAAVPYVLALVIMASKTVFWSTTMVAAWVNAAKDASAMSMRLSILLAAFIGGNAIAGERADRSAEFAGGLPIARGKSVASKAVIAAGSSLALWAINLAVWGITSLLLTVGATNPPPRYSLWNEFTVTLICFLGTLLLLGLSWLYSSLLRSPAISAAAAIGTAMGLLLVIQVVTDFSLEHWRHNHAAFTCLFVLTPIISLLSWAAGVVVYLKRVETC